MDKETYEKMEEFVYQDLMNNGENDVLKVTIKVEVDGGHTEKFEYFWNKEVLEKKS